MATLYAQQAPPGVSEAIPAPGLRALKATQAAINYGGASPIIPRQEGGIFERVALQPHQRVTVALTALPPGNNTFVQAPDGGTLSDHTIAAAGNAPPVFTFEAAQHPGVYRVLVWTSAGKCELQFLVVDPAHPLPAADSYIPRAY